MHTSGISNFALGLLAASMAAPAEAFFRMSCPGRLVRERSDPIVNPGQIASHVHTISGGNGFGFSMTYEQARASQCSSCEIKEDMSNYWTPQLYVKKKNGKFEPVPVAGEKGSGNGGMTVYYLQRGDKGEKLHAFPEGFRVLAGDSSRRKYSGGLDQDAVRYACLGQGQGETTSIPNYKCPGGLRAQVFFPSCWDGKNLDSPDHKSHMSYPAGKNFDNGPCPPSHPVHLVSLFYEVLYDTSLYDSEWNGDKHPFVFSNGDATGCGFHGDFVNGWDVKVLQKAVDNCNALSGSVKDCPEITLFSADECHNCRLPSHVDEKVDGELTQLPGCNAPSYGPDPPAKGQCTDGAQIGQAESFFTDVTVSKGFEYLGCGIDNYYSRTLKGKSQSGDDMTVEKCVDFCKANRFSHAGLEYGRECYCDNAIATDRAPKPGVMGNCEMKCAGDDGEICGGTGALSIYRACQGGKCQNAQYGGNNNTATDTPAGPKEESVGGGNGNGNTGNTGNNPSPPKGQPPAPVPQPPKSSPTPSKAAAPVPQPPKSSPSPPKGQPPAPVPQPPKASPTTSKAASPAQPTPTKKANPPSYGHGHGHNHGRPRPRPRPRPIQGKGKADGSPVKAGGAPKPEASKKSSCS